MGDSNKDLAELAATTTDDFYDLLAVPFDADEPIIKRAYRKASIRYHPDKNPDSASAADKFILLGWARDILIDPSLKSTYDRARARRREKALQDDLLSGQRRRMKDDLERREREGRDAAVGLKRKRAADLSDAERREQEIARLAEDGKRRRNEAQARMRQQADDDAAAAATATRAPSPPPPTAPKTGQSPEINRTVRVRFARTEATQGWEKTQLKALFSKYGPVESVVLTKDKKLRAEGEKHRVLTATAFIIYTRLDHAHAAVLDAAADIPGVASVEWVGGEPDLGVKSPTEPSMNTSQSATSNGHAPPSTATATTNGNSTTTTTANPAPTTAPSTPLPRPKSFRASFGPGLGGINSTTPLGTPKFSFSPKTPSLEELTMMRLKAAEKKRLEDQIRRQEAEEGKQE